ncbi:MAG TPA: 16S rRNA (cytosine(1402)-N(4))-methyltransferase RsmH [Candidatus Binataceae bacterium]|nr:16S rRNA (cytosine(1402)-N(4))-methyltransferase RsmH [Candidatus Binataceae bacterium]
MAVAVNNGDSAAARAHVPVMVAEVREMLCASRPRLIVDATVGTGGHAAAMLDATDARLLGIDRDDAALAIASARLADFGSRVILRQADFGDIARVMRENQIDSTDAILADLGMSSLALDDPERGFSFRLDGPLDMRMDRRAPLRAYEIVNEESEQALADILHLWGEERAARRIARAIVESRRRRPIETTGELRMIIEGVLGSHRRGGVHPATRTFQALRIAVNHEMESLAALLADGPSMLAPGGRMAVIAYHSLEDRAVKERMRGLSRAGGYLAVTRKVVRPSQREVARNPRARSARLRCIERMAA